MAGKLSYEELEQKVKELENKAGEYTTTKDALNLFSHSFEYSIDGLAMANTDNKIICVNEAFAKMFGYSREEITGKKIGFIYSADQIPIVEKALTMTMEGGWTGELIGKKKDGTRFPVSVSSSRVLDDKGNVITHIASHRDITQQKQTLKALRESEGKWRSLAETAPCIILTVQRDGTIQFLNRSVGNYTPEDTIGTKVWDYVPPYYHSVMQSAIEQVFQTGLPISYEILGEGLKGPASAWYMTQLGPIVKDGQVVAVTMASTDITEIKNVHEALKESEEKYRTILESIEEGYYEVDMAGNFTFFNDSICKMLGYSRAELLGMNNREYTDKKTAKKSYKVFNKIYETGKPKNIVNVEIIKKNGARRNIEASGSLMKDSEGNAIGFRGIFRDMTERKRAERAIKKREAELASVNKQLIETNKALSVLAKNLDITQKESEKRIVQKIRIYIMPIIEKLRQDKNIERYRADFDLLTSYIRELTSDLADEIKITLVLSTTELRVASLIRNGMSNQEIAKHLYITVATVKTHRRNIRRKLDLHNSGINLKAYMKSELD